MYPHIKTTESLTIIINDKPYAVTSNHSNYQDILDIARGITEASEDVLMELIKPVIKLQRVVGSDGSGFFLEGSQVTCKIDGEDFPLPASLANEVLEVFSDKGNLAPLMNFVKRLACNPRKEVIDELWGFISSCGLAITEGGKFLAYKNVREDFKDAYTGTMDNSPGSHLTMPRWKVEHDPQRTCAAGLHFAAWGYLSHYASGRKTVILSIDPADVVSIPTDYNNMKGRACAYTVLREVEQPEELKYHTVFNDDGYYDEDYDDDDYEDEEYDEEACEDITQEFLASLGWIERHDDEEVVPDFDYDFFVKLRDGSVIDNTIFAKDSYWPIDNLASDIVAFKYT